MISRSLMLGLIAISALLFTISLAQGSFRISKIHQLTFEERDTAPVWSPDGSRIAFTSGRIDPADIWIAQIDPDTYTFKLERITSGEIRDWVGDWSPDGTKLAISRGTWGAYRDYDLWILDLTTGELKPVLQDPGKVSNYDPRFSPDGSRLVFHSNRDGDRDIWMIDLDGSNLTQLTNFSGDEVAPDFSPDGRRIVFACECGERFLDIWMMDADGTNLTRLTNTPELQETVPRFSPDGKHILFLRGSLVGIRFNTSIWIMDADGGNQTELLHADTYTIYMLGEFSPDGTKIAYSEGDFSGSSVKGRGIRIAELEQIREYPRQPPSPAQIPYIQYPSPIPSPKPSGFEIFLAAIGIIILILIRRARN